MNGTELERIARLEQGFKDFNKHFDDFVANHFKNLVDKVDCIVQKMSKPRLPLWVTFLITALFSLCVGLIVAFVKR